MTDVLPTLPPERDVTDILDQVYGAGNYLRVDDAQDQLWDPGGITASFLAKYSGADQGLGICIVCDGSDDMAFDQTFSQDGVNLSLMTVSGVSAPNVFGRFQWYIAPRNHPTVIRAQSAPSFNLDGLDHMVTYAILGLSQTYVLAWEDLPLYTDTSSDRDYNDLLVQITYDPFNFPTVPEPGTVLLLAVGLGALASLHRRAARN